MVPPRQWWSQERETSWLSFLEGFFVQLTLSTNPLKVKISQSTIHAFGLHLTAQDTDQIGACRATTGATHVKPRGTPFAFLPAQPSLHRNGSWHRSTCLSSPTWSVAAKAGTGTDTGTVCSGAARLAQCWELSRSEATFLEPSYCRGATTTSCLPAPAAFLLSMFSLFWGREMCTACLPPSEELLPPVFGACFQERDDALGWRSGFWEVLPSKLYKGQWKACA